MLMQVRKLTARPNYVQSTIFTEDLVAVQMKKQAVDLCKPIYAGFTVLEEAKYLMNEFQYGYILPTYGPDRARLLFTDTDSFCYLIQTDSVYEDMGKNLSVFDTSDYPKDHFLHSEHNKKVIGKFKDETNGEPIQEFVGLRPKMYSMLCRGQSRKRAKGVSKTVVKKKLTHDDFRRTLFDGCQQRDLMKQFRSEKHQVDTMNINKISLSAFDDKRYIHNNGITSFANGHYKISRKRKSDDTSNIIVKKSRPPTPPA